jgi:hypothetical protein
MAHSQVDSTPDCAAARFAIEKKWSDPAQLILI